MKHLLWVVGLIALGPTLYYFQKFYQMPEEQGKEYLAIAGVFFLVSLICFAVFFFLRFKEEGEQDISITKF